MTMKEYSGTVSAIQGKVALIEIDSHSPQIKDDKRKVAEVTTERKDLYVGRRVVVLVESIPGNKAAIFSYILPVVLFVATFFALNNVTSNTSLAVLLAVFTMIPYYSILWVIMARSQGRNKFSLKTD